MQILTKKYFPDFYSLVIVYFYAVVMLSYVEQLVGLKRQAPVGMLQKPLHNFARVGASVGRIAQRLHKTVFRINDFSC